MTDDRLPTEHEEQREFVCWFRQTYRGVRIFAIPNGGLRGRAAAAKLKAEGVSAGVPDLCIPEWSLWVEMKRQKGGVVSADQKDWINYLSSIGHVCIVAKGFEAARDAVIKFDHLMLFRTVS
jgi:hypothetical protein